MHLMRLDFFKFDDSNYVQIKCKRNEIFFVLLFDLDEKKSKQDKKQVSCMILFLMM